MEKKKIALIFGSPGSEHDVSVSSAGSVFAHFPTDRFDCVPIYIGKNGRWYTGAYTLDHFQSNAFPSSNELYLRFDYDQPGFYDSVMGTLLAIDAAFLMLHGRLGEGGQIQGLLNVANIPFIGCDVLSSAVCMDKAFTHMICESHGITMAPYQLITAVDGIDETQVTYPCVVKPAREGSSFGVSIARNHADLIAACNFALGFDSKVLIEDYIKATEVGLSILSLKDRLVVSDVDQVNISDDFFNFQEKYHPHNTQTLPKSEFPESVLNQIQEMGVRIFKLLDCKQFARLDFFVDQDLNIFLNEVNTIPGFTSNSRYPKMIGRTGIDFTQLITLLIEDIL